MFALHSPKGLISAVEGYRADSVEGKRQGDKDNSRLLLSLLLVCVCSVVLVC